MTAKVMGTASALGESVSPAELEPTAVTAGDYRNANFTVDADGRLTAAESWVIESADFNGDLTGPSALDTTTGVGKAFTNQPANDGVEILSDSALDITQSVTIIGTTTGTDTVVVETVALDLVDGTTPVASVKVDWGVILAVKLSAACVGTITVREASADATIVTIAPAALNAGVELVAAPDQSAWNRTVSLVSDGATTKQIGLKGTDSTGATIYDSQALAGTTAVLSNSAFVTVTEIYTGDLENTLTVTETATAGVKLDGSKIVTESNTATLANKTLTAPTIVDFTNAAHDHGDADDGGQLTVAAHSDYAAGNVAYDAANFTAQAGDWTVDAGDQVTLSYRRFGGLLFVAFTINTTDVSATPTYLAITLPAGLSVAVETRGQCDVRNNGTAASGGMWIMTGTQLRIYRDQTSTLWSITAGDNTYVQGIAIGFL